MLDIKYKFTIIGYKAAGINLFNNTSLQGVNLNI